MRLRRGRGGASGVERWTRYVRLLEYTRWGVEKPGRFDMTEDLEAETYDQIDLKEANIMPDGERGEDANLQYACGHGLISAHPIRSP